MISADQYFKEVPPATIFGDRRAQPRCSIRLPIGFTLVGTASIAKIGTGIVLDMSSTGIAFQTSEELRCGSFVNVQIPWLSGTTLVAYGRVVRKNRDVTAIQVLRRQFHRQEPNGNLQERIVPTNFLAVDDADAEQGNSAMNEHTWNCGDVEQGVEF